MALGSKFSTLTLQNNVASSSSQSAARTPSLVTVHPVALFSILDHYLRRNDSQDRVIGTLLGTRSENGVVEVKSSFAVLHNETNELVAVDFEYHKTMFDLHQKVNPKEVIVGWYSTGCNLNTYSALIHNFYSQQSEPHQAIHLALNTGANENEQPGVQAFVTSPLGVFPKPENAVFLPVPVELRLQQAERSGLDLLTTTASSATSTTSLPITDLEVLETAIQSITSMIDRVLTYVRDVLSGAQKGDAAVGRYLMNTLGGAGLDDLEKPGFSSSLQDLLMVSYLANLVRSQAEISARIALTSSS